MSTRSNDEERNLIEGNRNRENIEMNNLAEAANEGEDLNGGGSPGPDEPSRDPTSSTGARPKRKERPIIKKVRLSEAEMSTVRGIANENFVHVALNDEKVYFGSQRANLSPPHWLDASDVAQSLSKSLPTTEIELANAAVAFKDPCLDPVWSSLKGDKEIPALPDEPPEEEHVTEDQVEEDHFDEI